MSAPLSQRRLLRPRYVHIAADRLWLIDDSQPVAALFDPESGRFDRIVAWPEIPGPSTSLTIASVDNGLWMQYRGADLLALITVDGIHHAEYLEHTHLLTAGPMGAWSFRPTPVRSDVADTDDAPPRYRRQPGPPLLLAYPDGGTTRVGIDGSLMAADFDENTLHLGIEHAPWSRSYRESPPPAGYVLKANRSWLHVPVDGQPDRIEFDGYPRTPAGKDWHTSEYADVTYNERHRRKRAIGDGVRWHWGKSDGHGGSVLIRAFRSGSPIPARESILPDIDVVGGAARGQQLWLLARRRGRTVAAWTVLRLSVDEGRDVTISTADDLDISRFCRPVAPEPPNHASYVRYCIRRLEGGGFSKRMHDVRVEYVGTGSTGRLHISFTHDDYEGLTLVARWRLYDEQGYRLDDITRYAPVELMEQADTRAYPSREHAVGGVLYV